jgi:septal ring factor EnvC (AmiA/AmiB activator)
MVETLITASPEFINTMSKHEQREYFSCALAFMESKIGKENIIAAVVHMDERTSHMHLSFCPLTHNNRLSAKDILGNQAQLSRWQTDYHNYMSSRWPQLERGLSSMQTGRKHIPLWLFKTAERLDKQVVEVESALAGINPLNAKKQRDKALSSLKSWLPQAERFTAQLKTVDNYIKALELAEREADKRAQEAENAVDNQIDNVVTQMQNKIDGKETELQEAWKEAQRLRRIINKQETLIYSLPLEIRERLMNKSTNERGRDR